MLRRLVDRLFGGSKTPPEPPAPEAPVLRNKAGGMAWIKDIVPGTGADVLNGRAAKTVSLNANGYWLIEPEQSFTVTASHIHRGTLFMEGDTVIVGAIADGCLEPWKEDGISDEEVRDLYAPDSGQRLPVYTFDNLPRQG